MRLIVDEVGVRLSVKDRVGFSRDMETAARDVDQFGDKVDRAGREAATADRRVGAFGRATRGLQSSYRSALGPSRAFALALGAGVTAAGVGVALAARQGWTELQELNKVETQTAAAMRSTGGVANVSAKHIRERSMALEELTTIDENVIGSAQNMLLTFTKVRNEVGAGNKIFDRATMAAANLSVRGFGDMSSASKMMGKALNDPIKGMTAMSRAGVTFTQTQIDAVKEFVETNNILGAQKLILKELETQVGGSAKAYGDSVEGMGNRVSDAFGDLSREAVTLLVPVVERGLRPIVRFLTRITDLVKEGGWKAVWEEFVPPWLADNIELIGGAIAGALIPALIAATPAIYAAITAFASATLALAPWMAIGVLAALIITNWDKISGWTKKAWGVVSEAISDAWGSVRNAVGNALGWITDKLADFVDFFFNMGGKILAGADWAFGWMPGIGDDIGRFKDKFNEMTDGMVSDLRHQADEFRSWERKISGEIAAAGNQWARFTEQVRGSSMAGFSFVPESLEVERHRRSRPVTEYRAFGGPVNAFQPYWVGERGMPEIFVPQTSGRIVAPDIDGSGGGGVPGLRGGVNIEAVNLHLDGTQIVDWPTFKREIERHGPEFFRTLQQVIGDEMAHR